MVTTVSPPVERSQPTQVQRPQPWRQALRVRTGAPPLVAGDRLSRVEFERRYEMRADIKKAELIEGVVYMPSPVRLDHAQLHSNVMIWLGFYRINTSGVYAADNATVRLDLDNEVQPDALLRLDESIGGQALVSEDHYLENAPELIVEVAGSSASYDLHAKRHVYRRNGVREYLVLLAYEGETRWYVLREGEYKLLEPDENGVSKSEIFPGLWLDVERFWQDDMAGVLAVLQEGLASQAHVDFVAHLQALAAVQSPIEESAT